MFNGNVYGLVITMLTFVIAIMLTLRQIEQTGVYVELTIRPINEYTVAINPENKPGPAAGTDERQTTQERQRPTH